MPALLPKNLVGSYQRYKQDTESFTSWLSKAATSCGWTAPPSNSESRTNNKQNCKKKQQQRGIKRSVAIPVKELLNQAQIVAQSDTPRISIPPSVIVSVDSCIAARLRCTAWFQSVDADNEFSDEAKDAKHTYFVQILQEALEILKPCVVKTSNRERQNSNNSSEEQKHTPATLPQNMFENLVVEDAEEFYRNVSVLDLPNKKKSRSTPAQSTNIYESSMGVKSDIAFGVFCFFEDMHKIQEHVGNVWKRYKARKIDLISATVITTAAIELVRAAEDDVMRTLPASMQTASSFEAMVSIICGTEALKTSFDPNTAKKGALTKSFDHFVFQNTGRTLLWWLKVSNARKTKEPSLIPTLSLLRSDARYTGIVACPEVRKAQTDETFLIQLFMDAQLANGDLAEILRRTPFKEDQDSVQDDIFSKSQKSLLKLGAVKAWIVFASQLLIDIKDIMGAVSHRPFEEMRYAADNAETTLGLNYICHKCTRGGCSGSSGLKWGHENQRVAKAAYKLATRWMLPHSVFQLCWEGMRDTILHIQEHHSQLSDNDDVLHTLQLEKEKVIHSILGGTYNHVTAKPSKKLTSQMVSISANAEPFFLFHSNPLWSGNMLLQLTVKMEDAAVTLANHKYPILSIAHLYNALQQLELLEYEWPELEQCMDTQKMALFGSQVPSEPKEMYNRLLTRMGYAPAHFACSGFRTCPCTPKLRKNKRVYDFRGNNTFEIFRQMYDDELSLEQSLYRIDSLMATANSRKRQTTNLNPLEFLSQLGVWMPAVVSAFEDVDYIALAKEGDDVLDRVALMIDATIEDPYEHCFKTPVSNYVPSNSALISNVLYMGMRESVLTLKTRKDFHYNGGEMIHVAADVINDHLARKQGYIE